MKVYVEARPKGRPEGTRIDDYVVENHADSVLHTAKTQEAAIKWAKDNGHEPHVARVRHLNDKKKPRPLAQGVEQGTSARRLAALAGRWPTCDRSSHDAQEREQVR